LLTPGHLHAISRQHIHRSPSPQVTALERAGESIQGTFRLVARRCVRVVLVVVLVCVAHMLLS
jgi:hypothetical protein